MKSIMLSIQPKWCELIAKGKKTVEVRKTMPELKMPFKVYIYCTKGEFLWKDNLRIFTDGKYNRITDELPEDLLNGKVIGEFVCDRVQRIKADGTCNPKYGYGDVRYNFGHLEDSQLSEKELYDYLGEPTILTDNPSYIEMEFNGYAWHISDLVIYDKPKELDEFLLARHCFNYKNVEIVENSLGVFIAKYYENAFCRQCKHYDTGLNWCNKIDELNPLKTPPRSWCYVERI